uniref:Uncharacterized protein n=1 Tax=Euplotes crassus TaxID=5936 RepID=A0A7S3K669_EUPCR|mmetsp:Transcript_11144/g.11097  ORF Transcript_11144/g.11097 Transcript_11144/m.11097 type:complete len:149 (+) Transcript_11144:1-447(+)
MKYTGMMTAEDISDTDYDFLYKIMVVGDMATGKTNIAQRFLGQQFENTSPTCAVEFAFKDYTSGTDDRLRLQVWDTSGDDKHKCITFAHLRRALGVILVYDVCNQDSFFNLHYWIDVVRENADEHVMILLMPNKCDLLLKHPEKRQIK